MSSDSEPRSQRLDRFKPFVPWLSALVLSCGLAWYGGFLFRNLSFTSGGPDTSGYMNGARAIAQGRIHRPVVYLRLFKLNRGFARMFTPLGFAPSPGQRMHPTYPPGLSVHLAIFGLIGGWTSAPYLVAPLAALGALLMTYLVGRELTLGIGYSAAAAAFLAVSPPFIWHAVQPASDVVATFWALLAVWAALAARRRPSLAILAGAALGVGVWVRPTNLLLAVPLLFALRLRIPLLLRLAAGALPFGLGILWWNAAVYGGALRTGYGGFGDVVSWKAFGHTWTLHVNALKMLMTRFLFPTGLAVIFDWSASKWTRALLASWFAVFIIFYSFYGFFDGWFCARFLLPAFPAIILGAMLLARDLIAWAPWSWIRCTEMAGAAVLAWWLLTTTWMLNDSLQVFRAIPDLETIYPQTIAWAESRLPDDAIVLSGLMSGAFQYYAERPIVRPDQLTNDDFQLLRAYAGMANLKWYGVISDDEATGPDFDRRFSGRWTLISRFKNVKLYRLDS